MSKSRRPYPVEYRAEMVRLVRAGRGIEELSREFEPSHQTIRNWVRQADVDDGQRDGLTTAEREELRRLRRENRILREEKEILAKAAAWFAEEAGSTPRRRFWVRESQPGYSFGAAHVPVVGCLPQRLLRVAVTFHVGSTTNRPDAERSDRGDPSPVTGHLWGASGTRRTRC